MEKNRRSCRKCQGELIIGIVLLGVVLFAGIACFQYGVADAAHGTSAGGDAAAPDQSIEDEPDIEWFRREMKISPKYEENDSGVLGMSWTHFFTMVFLAIFFVGVLIQMYLKNRRTAKILEEFVRKENE
jgi:hypothetical protein